MSEYNFEPIGKFCAVIFFYFGAKQMRKDEIHEKTRSLVYGKL